MFRTRDLLVRQRTQTINALRGHLAEFGVVAAKGLAHIGRLVTLIEDTVAKGLCVLRVLVEGLKALDRHIDELDREIERRAKEDSVARRLVTIPGIGAVTATALVSLSPPAANFRRDFAA